MCSRVSFRSTTLCQGLIARGITPDFKGGQIFIGRKNFNLESADFLNLFSINPYRTFVLSGRFIPVSEIIFSSSADSTSNSSLVN